MLQCCSVELMQCRLLQCRTGSVCAMLQSALGLHLAGAGNELREHRCGLLVGRGEGRVVSVDPLQ